MNALMLLAFFSLISCNQKQSAQQTLLATDPAVKTSWKVTGCAEMATRTKMASNNSFSAFPEKSAPGQPEILVAGDSISYTREVTHLCCREVTVAIKKEKSLITITEHWFRPGCKCRCSSVVQAVAGRLSPGEYQVIVVETGTNPVDDSPSLIADTIARKNLTIR